MYALIFNVYFDLPQHNNWACLQFFFIKGLNTIKIGTLVVYYVSYHNLQIIIYNQNDTVSVFDYFCKALTVFH